jgi:hypothetical protein
VSEKKSPVGNLVPYTVLILTCIFVVMKLTGAGVVKTWSWWWVLSPVWIWLAMAVLIWVPLLAILAVIRARQRRKRREAALFLMGGLMSGARDANGQTAAQAIVAAALERAAERQRQGRTR